MSEQLRIDEVSRLLGSLEEGQKRNCDKLKTLALRMDELHNKLDKVDRKLDMHVNDKGRHYKNGFVESWPERMKRHAPEIGGGAILGGVAVVILEELIRALLNSMGVG